MTDGETDIDTSRVESYLSSELGVSVVETEVLHDGLNLSLAVSTENTEDAYVLRRPNKFRQTDGFLDVNQEYRVLEHLQGTGIDAPEPVLVCEDESVIGDPFLVMTYLDGVPVHLGSYLPGRFRRADARERIATLLIETLADIHSLNIGPLTGVCERQTPLDQVTRTVDRLDESTSVTGHDSPGLRDVADWLEQNAPSKQGTALVHGDFRPANVLFVGDAQPEISGVLDWETAFLGDPLTELGYLLLRWRDDSDPVPSLDRIESQCSNEAVIQDLKATNEHGLAPFTNEPGSPSRQELVTRYEARTGLSFENERFYRALAAFILATIWSDLHRTRVEAGTESDWVPYVDYMSMLAESIISGEFQL